jgi:hypothetical protein
MTIAASTSLETTTGYRAGLEWLVDVPWLERLAFQTINSQVQVWDAVSGALRQTLDGGAPRYGYIHPVAWSPDGLMLAAGSTESQITVWDVGTGRRLRKLTGHRNGVTAVTWSPKGRWLASASHDRSVRLWRPDAKRRSIWVLDGHQQSVIGLAWSRDGQLLASASHDGTVRIWDALLGRQKDTLSAHAKVNKLDWSPDGTTIACTCWAPTCVKLLDVETGASRVLERLTDPRDVAYSPDGRWLATAANGTVLLWSTNTWESLGDGMPGFETEFQATGNRLAVSVQGGIQLWDLAVDDLADRPADAEAAPVSNRGVVFISHSSQDARRVEQMILEPFRRAGIPTWYSAEDIRTAEEWERSIRTGLQSCSWFLVIVSPHAVRSDWVRTEVSWAVRHRPGRIVPVLIEDCDPEDLHLRLAMIQNIDLRAQVEHNMRELVALLKSKSH